MHLHHFESPEDEDKPFDMEEPNFFGDVYKRQALVFNFKRLKREELDGLKPKIDWSMVESLSLIHISWAGNGSLLGWIRTAARNWTICSRNGRWNRTRRR